MKLGYIVQLEQHIDISRLGGRAAALKAWSFGLLLACGCGSGGFGCGGGNAAVHV